MYLLDFLLSGGSKDGSEAVDLKPFINKENYQGSSTREIPSVKKDKGTSEETGSGDENICEEVDEDGFDQDLFKKKWRTEFIKKGGFQHLVKILMEYVTKGFNSSSNDHL